MSDVLAPKYANHFKLALAGETRDAQITFVHRVPDPDAPGTYIDTVVAEVPMPQDTFKELGSMITNANKAVENWQLAQEQHTNDARQSSALDKLAEHSVFGGQAPKPNDEPN